MSIAKKVINSAMEELDISSRRLIVRFFNDNQKIFAGFLEEIGGRSHHPFNILRSIIISVVIGPSKASRKVPTC